MDIKNNFISIEQVTGKYLDNQKNKQTKQTSGVSFKDIFLQQTNQPLEKTSELKFSKHAGERLESRNITISDEQMKRLEDGTKKAMEKGINDSLVLVDDMAFIVNVENSTVVTAMDRSEAQEKVFTNIDGAVII